MKILIVQTMSGEYEDLVNLVKKKMADRNKTWTVEIWKTVNSRSIYEAIKAAEADLIVTFNLAGFEQSTLTDNIAYNLLNCKQIHILLGNCFPNEKFLSKQLSIAMFFYCMDTQYYRYLFDKYPDIPYLKSIDNWKEERDADKKADMFCSIVQEVLEICHLN